MHPELDPAQLVLERPRVPAQEKPERKLGRTLNVGKELKREPLLEQNLGTLSESTDS